ncbi:MAG: hypothetical protein DU480_07480 [Nitrosomonas sp.]|uniref:hypothetical protein n=1 Tax=Nitrosomonas sp. TaxID=42353 RepID=UPI0032EFBDB9
MKIPGFVSDVAINALGSILGGITFSLIFFVWSDYIFKQPDLNGHWFFTITYEKTSHSNFQDLQVTYEVILIQDGLRLTGSGEKVSEIQKDGTNIEYEGDNRTPIDIEGTINYNYLSHNNLNLHYKESGSLRESASFHRLTIFDTLRMKGTWESTIANSSGMVAWSRKK